MQRDQTSNWHIWHDAAKRDRIDAAIRNLYADMAAAVAERRPVCNASGRCCKFETYGHRLYVTTLEIAWFLQHVTPTGSVDAASIDRGSLSLKQLAESPSQDACPYQIDGLCSVHTVRPLGCRIYFCEEGTESWQQDKTELFLDRLKQLHIDEGIPYQYMEWRAGLAEATEVLGDLV
ncbi:MAG: hypothetical protein AB8C95_02750 [Phycisphaeraceae bacterium]